MTVARARNTDPMTSHEAATRAELSGSAQNQRDKCLEVVKAHSNHTAAEIALIAGIDRYAASRRLPELRQRGLVRNGVVAVCGVTKTKAMTWILNDG